MQRIDIHNPTNPRLDDYRELKEARLAEASGKFVAESEVVVKKLLASPFHVDSLLVTEPRLAALTEHLRPDVPIYVVTQTLMDGVAGFHVHRGCLAVGRRRVGQLPAHARCLLVLEDVTDTDNVGAVVRNAAAFGADAVVLSPRSANPFYRKAIRTSTGHVFNVPIVRLAQWPQDLWALKSRYQIIGASLAPRAVPLPTFVPKEPIAIVMGTEGRGLSPEVCEGCDALVTIPMAPTGDSLNIAVASAVMLYGLGLRFLPR